MKYRKQVKPIDHRVRKITGSFSWIDHRFITERLIDLLGRDEILLYLWLITVGDRNGVSFYSDEKTASRIKLAVNPIQKAREGLIEKGFVIYRKGITQVLPLPLGDYYV